MFLAEFESAIARLAELEAENRNLKRITKHEKWIPVSSGIRPNAGQRILATYLNKENNAQFDVLETYFPIYETEIETYKLIAWMPAPEEYKSKVPSKYKESIMNHFVRVE